MIAAVLRNLVLFRRPDLRLMIAGVEKELAVEGIVISKALSFKLVVDGDVVAFNTSMRMCSNVEARKQSYLRIITRYFENTLEYIVQYHTGGNLNDLKRMDHVLFEYVSKHTSFSRSSAA